MCIVLFRWQPESDEPLLLAANRDEFHARPTEAARLRGNVFSGLDLRAGGTWIGLRTDGRLAAVTNFREPLTEPAPGSRSRGQIPVAYLASDEPASTFARNLLSDGSRYGGFNLLLFDREELIWASNRGDVVERVTPGVHGLSNGRLDEPWPKVERGKALFRDALERGAGEESILDVLRDTVTPRDDTLPRTGVTLEIERLVAPIFIRSDRYGTRSSTIARVRRNGSSRMLEERFAPDGVPIGRSVYDGAEG